MSTETRNALRLQMEVSTTTQRLLIAIGMSGVLAFFATLSFPLPWTPVPFSIAPIGLLLIGVVNRPAYALLSVFIYMAAAGLGAPIFAGGASGWSHFVGGTAGYLLGYAVQPTLISYWLRQDFGHDSRTSRFLFGGAFALALALLVAGIAFLATGTDLSDYGYQQWNLTSTMVWIFAGASMAGAGIALALLKERMRLFAGLFGSILVLHTLGVAGLILILDLSISTALVVGSLVFLPFDVLKVGAVTAMANPFLVTNHD